MVRRRTVPALLAVVLAGAVGCGHEPGASSALEGEWALVAGTGAEGPFDLDDADPVSLSVVDGEVRGTAACNLYTGAVDAADDGVRINLDGVTARGCDGPTMDLEMTYLAALSAVGGAHRDGDALVLTGSQVELRFEVVPEVPDAELVGTDWLLGSVITGETASSTHSDPATLRFAADGTLTGSTGCRAFTGTWREADWRVEVVDLEPEEATCDDEFAQRQDDRVLSTLGGEVEFETSGDQLRLSDADGGLGYRAED
ncbi:META domain-containing protein [Actinoalloteichus caeruleus]|uniref:META domain-containing protein n=1 Tax=Actinoalloteichus cyanogriseus TaxID=2893586 RepID=UPI003AABD176